MNNPLTWLYSGGALCKPIRSLLFLIMFCFLASPALAQPSVKVVTAAQLTEDTRLQRKITLDETGIPMQDLLRKLSNSDLSLSAGRSCADLKLQIRLKQRPLHILLHSLAQLLPGYWEPLDNKKGYRLSMNGSAISRRENWWHLFLSERERAKAEQRAFLLERMRSEPVRSKPGDSEEESSDPAIEERRATEHEFFRNLPSALQEEIANLQTDCPLYSIGDVRFGTSYEEEAVSVPLTSLPTQVQERLLSKATAIFSTGTFPFHFENAVVNFTNGGFIVIANVEIATGRSAHAAFSFNAGIAPNSLTLTLNHQLLAIEVKRLGKKAPDTWKKLAAYQESRVWKNDPPSRNRRNHTSFRRAEVLEWLGEKADIEYVADFYGHPGHSMPPQVREIPPVAPLKEELNFQAADNDMSWKQRPDSIYLFRNNRWYRDDALDVPGTLLNHWYERRMEQQKQQGETTKPLNLLEKMKQQMDWHAEVVHSLTLWQIVAGFSDFIPKKYNSKAPADSSDKNQGVSLSQQIPNLLEMYPFRLDSQRIMRQINTTQFYASLNDTARNALITGRLPFSTLTRKQQENSLRLVPRLRAVLLQQPNQPVFLGLQPRSEGDFRKSNGDVRLTFASSPPPQ